MKSACLAILALASFAAELPRSWQGIPGIEHTPKGRVFVAWYTGGFKEPSVTNSVLLAYGDGKTFTAPEVMAGPRDGARAFDPTLWRDPAGRLWYIYNRGTKDTAEHGVWARICYQPDAKTPSWGAEFRIGFDEAAVAFRMNKPIVLSTGEWVLPVTHSPQKTYDWFARSTQVQGVAISTNKGKSWKLHGAVQAPEWALENMVVELRDKRLWMLTRTGAGVLWESFSSDRGKTWTPGAATKIASPGSRFFVRRLASGNLLLVNHHRFQGRSHLTAQLSADDGKTWNDGLLLDERKGVSYPDGVEDKDGLISVVYDRDRQGAGEILQAQFTEKDVLAGKPVSGRVQLRQVLNALAPWDPKAAGDRVMSGLVNVSGPEVKGAHDAEFVIVDNRAYIVSMANEVQPGENAEWPFVYCTMSIVDLRTMAVTHRIPLARGKQAFANETLPEGACFVPRIIRKDATTLRTFFASEAPRQREAQSYYRDFDLTTTAFHPEIHRMKIQTATGTHDMQPARFHADAAAQGFTREPKDYGLYTIDSFKTIDNATYTVMNNYPGGQNGLARLNPAMDTFEVLGHFNGEGPEKLTEAAVNRLPDGTWLAIARQDGGTANYMFASSWDGRLWTTPRYRDLIANGASSKPNFERFNGTYYLGWQEATKIDGVSRSVFNIDVSTDGIRWKRRYRFETNKSFQYVSLHEYKGAIYLTVTQGDTSPSRKERILFGQLE